MANDGWIISHAKNEKWKIKWEIKDKILKSPNSVCYWVSFLLLDINKKWNKFSGRCRRHQPWQLSRNNTIIIRVRHRLEYDENKKNSVVFIHLAIRRPSKFFSVLSLSLSHICVMSHTFKRDLSCFSFCIFTFRKFTVSSQKIFSPSHNYFYFILFYFFFCSLATEVTPTPMGPHLATIFSFVFSNVSAQMLFFFVFFLGRGVSVC